MATPRANEEVLKVILTKLHRLETAFGEINNRLSTIESSVVSETGSWSVASPRSSFHLASCSCASCINSQPLQRKLHEGNHKQHPAAAAYRCSVDKLRDQFDLDSNSELASVSHEEGIIYGRNSEDQSRAEDNYLVSDGRSRPASQYEICHRDTKPVISAPKAPPSPYGNNAPQLHEETIESPGTSRSSSMRSPTKVGSLLSTPKSHSPAATFSSLASPCWSGHNTRNDALKKIRGPITRARSMRYRKTKPSNAQRNAPIVGPLNDTSLVVDATLIRRLEEKEFLRLYKLAEDSAKACITFGQKMMHVVTQRRVNQQLKLLHPRA
ncbi:hypothetical protein LZ30DRAFT_379846 [Colletotrichum cereale]|nr:hypothetical protein LZ30DRAFT_379846 [Colletotrichum cereale]